MNDKMTPIPAGEMLDWILTEQEQCGTIFGVSKLFHADQNKALPLFSEQMETPFGPAAGPHTQLAQNIVAAYASGARFFELKTVQTLDGEDLPVSKPCIKAEDECYNVEWSTELYVPQAMDEYIKGWFLCKLLAKEYGLGDPDGFIFNMSVGYDLEGIRSQKIDSYIEGMRDASGTAVWKECLAAARGMIGRFKNVDAAYIDGISPKACDSITLSTLHGCPPQEIENIATYLIEEKGLNTFIKCNPTLLGYEYARGALDSLGFDYIAFDDHHFKGDLQYADAVPMMQRLQKRADDKGVAFGVKLTNTFPVQVTRKELPGEEMYMSGRSLYPLTISLAEKLAEEFDGKLRISFSGGADAFNIADIVQAGIWPVTLATTLLKAGGYNRQKQIADALYALYYSGWTGVDVAAVKRLKKQAFEGEAYRKPVKPIPPRKIEEKVPLTDCFTAPCSHGCPIHQDIPAYVGLVGEGKYLEALEVIVDKNPLPFITGTICNHRCQDKCTRNFYEESVQIRDTKLVAAQKAMDELLENIEAPEMTGARTAVIGGGAAGLAAAYFLARRGVPVTVFEQDKHLGGIVRNIVPAFRVPDEVVDNDVRLIEKMGVSFVTGMPAPSVEQLKAQGYVHIVLAVGAYKPGKLELEGDAPLNVLDFLRRFRADEAQDLGGDVIIIGGGNTAMDAARAAKRVPGVKTVSLVYRRTKRYMPADEEELLLAMEDGVQFMELLAPVSHKNGVLSCNRMVLGEPDESGRRRPVATDEVVELPASTVIAAVGEHVDDTYLTQNGVAVTARGKAEVDEQLMTSVKGVYIAGDANRGPATAVEAIADAARIASAICAPPCQNVFAYDSGKAREKKGVLVPACGATCEGERCLECNVVCECCVDVCPNRANVSVLAQGRPQIVHVDKMCNECGNCETFCPYDSAPYKDKFTLFATPAEFESSTNEGFLILEDGKCRVRVLGSVYETDDYENIPDDLVQLMETVAGDYAYLV